MKSDKTSYKIMRLYENSYRPVTVKTGLTIEEARKVCTSANGNSRTCESKFGNNLTRERGEWILVFTKEGE